MRRLVLDPGVFVSALITPGGAPGRLLKAVREGEFELVVSPHLLWELNEMLRQAKFRRYLGMEAIQESIDRIRRSSLVVPDPDVLPPLRCADPKDDYLIALAFHHNAILVSGDKHLLEIGGGAPILAPADLQRQPV